MNAPKFTPGPWRWNDSAYSLRPINVSSDVTSIIELESKGMVARPQSRPWPEIEREIDANLNLIAAAPELYEALEGVERKLAAYVGVCTGDKELTGTVLPMTRAALAKAQGGAA